MKSSTNFKLTAGLLGLALVIGGAGVSFPLLQLALGTAAVLVAAYFVLTPSRLPSGPLDRWATVLLALVLLLPLIQLIPLPPGIWHLLPGREVPKELGALLGLSPWRPWTLDVEGTIRSWLVLIPPAVVFMGCLRLDSRERVKLLWVVPGFALLNAFLGIVQFATGGGATPYPSAHIGDPIGFFVNRNHSAAVMLAAMPVIAAIAVGHLGRRRSPTSRLPAAIACIAILAIVVIGTTSRTGLLLLPVALAVSLFILLRRDTPLRSALPGLLAVIALGVVLVTSRGFDRIIDRFTSGPEARFAYWTDVQWALQQYGLAGTGIGTFVPVFQSAESLETVVPQVVNHAHNDYLEVLLGAGLTGALLFVVFLVLVVLAVGRDAKQQNNRSMDMLRLACATSIALLLAYSAVDYPLRMPALAAAFLVFCALILPAASERTAAPSAHARKPSQPDVTAKPRQPSRALLGPLVVIWLVMLQAGMSARAIADQRYDDAAMWANWSTRANAALATEALAQDDSGRAWSYANAALALSPINVEAMRDLALVRLAQGSDDGHRLMRMAAGLGWRDVIVQLWTIAASQKLKEPEKAVQRAEGLFRQGRVAGPALNLLLSTNSETTPRLLAARLAERPDWRGKVLNRAGELSEADFPRFETVVALLAATRAPVTGAEVKPVIDAMINQGRAAEAQRLWVKVNPALVDNGAFSQLKESSGQLPAGWQVPPQNRSATAIVTYDGTEKALRVGHTNWVTLISQATMLPAGNYRLAFAARELGAGPVLLRWEVRCRGSSKAHIIENRVDRRSGWKTFNANFDVPARDCLSQTLVLRRFEADNAAETMVDRVRIIRAAS